MDILKSKKFIIAIVTGLIVLANDKFTLGFDQATINTLAALATAYIVGQGVADMGKEKSKLELREADKAIPDA